MELQERRRFEQIIREAYSGETPNSALQEIVETLPKRYRDVIQCRVIEGLSWFDVQDRLFYTERRGRDILIEAIAEVQRRMGGT